MLLLGPKSGQAEHLHHLPLVKNANRIFVV
jgi:hypothetical protein